MKVQNFTSALRLAFNVFGSERAESISNDIQTILSDMVTFPDSVNRNISMLDQLLRKYFFELYDHQSLRHISQLQSAFKDFVINFIAEDEAIKIIDNAITKFLNTQRRSGYDWAKLNCPDLEPYSCIPVDIFKSLVIHQNTFPKVIFNSAVLLKLETICLDYFNDVPGVNLELEVEVWEHAVELLNCIEGDNTQFYDLQDCFQNNLLEILCSEELIILMLQETIQHSYTYLSEVNSYFNIVLSKRILDANLNKVLEQYFNMKFNEMRDQWNDNELAEMIPWGLLRNEIAELFSNEARLIQHKVRDMILSGTFNHQSNLNQLLLTEEGRQRFLLEVKVNRDPEYSAKMLCKIHQHIVLHQFQDMLQNNFIDQDVGDNSHQAMIFLRTTFNQLPFEVICFCSKGINNSSQLEELITKYADDLHVLCQLTEERLALAIEYVIECKGYHSRLLEKERKMELASLVVKPENLPLSNSLSRAIDAENLRMFSLFLPKASLKSLRIASSQVKNRGSILLSGLTNRVNELSSFEEEILYIHEFSKEKEDTIVGLGGKFLNWICFESKIAQVYIPLHWLEYDTLNRLGMKWECLELTKEQQEQIGAFSSHYCLNFNLKGDGKYTITYPIHFEERIRQIIDCSQQKMESKTRCS